MKSNYVKRTQKDYPLSVKLSIVQEIEQGELTKRETKIKYGIQGDSTILNWLKNMVILTGKIRVICHQRIKVHNNIF